MQYLLCSVQTHMLDSQERIRLCRGDKYDMAVDKLLVRGDFGGEGGGGSGVGDL